jgi:hypothetical protein
LKGFTNCSTNFSPFQTPKNSIAKSNFNKHDLVGGFTPTPMKNMKVSRDDEIPNIWKNEKCSKLSTKMIY